MENILRNRFSEEEERIRVLKLRASKTITLKRFSPEIRNTINKIIDELVCEVIFQIHMELNISVATPNLHSQLNGKPSGSLSCMAEELNVLKVNQDVDCPKCCVLVKCLWLSKHLAVCMNPEQSSFSYSSRNSSRIARQRIQEGFRSTYEESKNDSDDEEPRAKKRRKTKKKEETQNCRLK